MNNEELLHAIGELIEKKLTEERQYTRQIVKEEIAANNKIIGTIIRVELAAIEKKITQRLDAQDGKIDAIKTESHFSKN